LRRPSNRRQASSSTHIPSHRARAGSISTLGRRARAPTLAGQALEHHDTEAEEVKVQEDMGDMKEKRLARTFLVLRLPESHSGEGSGVLPSRKGKEKAISVGVNGNGTMRPSLSTSSSRSSVRTITSSGRSTPTRDQTINDSQHISKSNGDGRFQECSSARQRTDSVSSSVSMRRIPTGPNGTANHKLDAKEDPPPPTRNSIPFYISPTHHPSTNPRFLQLEEGDFAPWLTVEESASNQAVLEVWYEDIDQNKGVKWRKLNTGVVRDINLGHLRRLDSGTKLGDNSVLVTLAIDPRSTYYLDPSHSGIRAVGDERSGARDAVERSRRETRMKKGVGLGGIHQ
jgi:hypothetical protein